MWRIDTDIDTLPSENLWKWRSDSPGGVSISSDTSLDFPLNFKPSEGSPAHRCTKKEQNRKRPNKESGKPDNVSPPTEKLIFWKRRSDSPGGVSMSSDTSLDFPLNFKPSNSSPAHSYDEEEFLWFHSKDLWRKTLDMDAAEEPESETDTPGFRCYHATCISDLLMVPSPPRILQLLWNHLGDLGMKRLSVVLENPPNNLDIVRVVLKTTAESLITLLTDGISSLNRVYGALITADVDPVTGQCFNSDYIRRQIVQAHQHLEQSEQTASSGLKSLDENLERLTEEEGKLEQEKSSTETHLENLRTVQASNEELHRYFEGALEQAERNLNSTKQTLQDQEHRKYKAEIVTGVGGGLMIIPVVGWITGIGMMIGGGVEINNSKHAVREAEEEVRKAGDEVTRYKTEVLENKSRIFQTRISMRQKECELERTCERIQSMRKQREMIGEFQGKMRKAMHLLGLLSKESSMVEHQTRRFILQDPVRKMMEDVMRVTKQIGQNDERMRRI